MIYWENRDSVDSVGNMSKADILRGIVNEKLATAAREILAVVERTVAGYEEEASGFREEIDRQRRQLEAFQPKVKLERPDLHEYEAFAVHEGKVEQHCQHTALEDTRTLSFDRQQEGDDDEEERLALSFSQIQDMDYPSPSRGLSDMATGRCVLAEDMDHLVLRVRMLEDSQTTVLSNSVFMKAPLLEVQCPRGLKEAEFVDLLRSTFPQLARGKIFDIFTTDRSKKLQPLKLKTLTPEEIDRSIRSTGAGRSALYIRLKTGDTLQSSSGEIGLLQRDKDAANNCPASAAVAAAHQTPSCAVDQSERRRGRRGLRVSTLKDSQCSVLSKYGVEDVERPGLLCGEDGEEQGEEEMSAAQYAQSQDDPNDVDYQVPSRSLFSRGSFEKRKFSKSQFSDAGTHLYLRIRLLEDPQALVVSNTVLKRSFLQEVQCPLGMQEVEFLELLRSTFPQLAGGEPFDVFITDKTKKLKPLSLKTLTPEAINTYIRSSGGGNSALYIKLKVGQDLLNSRKHLHLHRGDGIADHCPKTAAGVTTGETKTYTVDPLQTMGDRLVERRYRVLRMCMLQDYQGDVLSKNVFMKSPVQKVKCTHGLQESDFLVMLKSIFPQMTEDKNHFDMFRADKKRKLHRLKLKTLTPDTVYKCLKTFGSKKSTLYFRMKKYQLGAKALQTGENLQSRNVDSLLQKYGDDTTSRRSTTSVMVTANQNKMCPRDKPLRKRRRRGEEPTHHVLGVCLLQDSQCDVISRFVFMKSPVRKVTCPRGLHEADFLELLRSTFPQLDGDKKSFDIFRTDRTRKLQQLLVKTLTPDEIFNSLKSVGSAKTFYIRLKTEAQAQSSSDKSHLLQKHDATNNYPTTPVMATTDQSNMHTVGEFKKKRRRRNEEPTHHVFRVCVLENPHCNVISRYVFQKSPLQEVKCARGLQEADFVNLLRTTFPQLDGDNKHFDILKTDKSRKLQQLYIKTLTPEEIYRSMNCFASGSRALYIRLKTSKDDVRASEQRRCFLPTNNDSAQDSQTSASLTISRDETRLHGRSPVENIGAKRSDVCSSSQTHEDVNTEETNDGDDHGPSEMMDQTESVDASPGDEIHHYEANDSGSNCKVNEALKDLRKGGSKWQSSNATRKRRARKRVKAKVTEKTKRFCKVCGISYMLMGRFIKHAWGHIQSPEHLCGVCGERFESMETLKAHLKNYQKIHSCSFCGKSFLTALRLKLHITVHTGESPYRCDICHKAFTNKSSLTTHRWVHVADKPHKCGICQKAFGLQAQLKAHSKNHTDKKFHCKICGEFLSDSQSLARHKVCHTTDRKYGCQACGKHFTHPQGLKLHKKIHTVADRPNLCHICLKAFVTKSDLVAHLRTSGCGSQVGRPLISKNHLKSPMTTHSVKKLFFCQVCGKTVARKQHLAVHMRTHSGEKPYHCTFCVKAFTQNHSLKKHMLSRHVNGNSSSEESKNIPQPVPS